MDKRHFCELPDIMGVDELMEYLNIGRTTAYKMLKDGSIPSIRIGKLYKVSKY